MIYIASPFFTNEQLKDVSAIESLLEATHTPYYSPRLGQASKRYGELIKKGETDSDEFNLVKKLVYLSNLEHLDKADQILVNLSGSSNLDSGTIWELGYFLSKLGSLSDIKITSKVTLFKDTEYARDILKELIKMAKFVAGVTASATLGSRYAFYFDFSGSLRVSRATPESIEEIHSLQGYPSTVVLAERADFSNSYCGGSKLVLGYLVGTRCCRNPMANLVEDQLGDSGVIYVDTPRKSNIMLTQSGVSVIELTPEELIWLHGDHGLVKVDSLLLRLKSKEVTDYSNKVDD